MSSVPCWLVYLTASCIHEKDVSKLYVIQISISVYKLYITEKLSLFIILLVYRMNKFK